MAYEEYLNFKAILDMPEPLKTYMMIGIMNSPHEKLMIELERLADSTTKSSK